MEQHGWGVQRGRWGALLGRTRETGQDGLQTRGPTPPPLQTWGHVSSKNSSRASSRQATPTHQGHRAGLCTLRGLEKGQPGSESSGMLALRLPGQQGQRASAGNSGLQSVTIRSPVLAGTVAWLQYPIQLALSTRRPQGLRGRPQTAPMWAGPVTVCLRSQKEQMRRRPVFTGCPGRTSGTRRLKSSVFPAAGFLLCTHSCPHSLRSRRGLVIMLRDPSEDQL